ncbi:VOC family protein [Streptomyces sp. NPDC059649]|uniref:VOC family protein n=1 Tax=Streptomyces sp. NPDC059649 TaxID=3346895 RepID=UPI00367BC94E
MSVSLRAVVIESPDPVALGAFWSAVLESTIEPGTDGVVVRFGQHPEQFLYIVEGRRGGNCLQEPLIEVAATGTTLDEEADRLASLGAEVIDRKWNVYEELHVGSVLFADPEGNRFRLLSSDEEVRAAERNLEAE